MSTYSRGGLGGKVTVDQQGRLNVSRAILGPNLTENYPNGLQLGGDGSGIPWISADGTYGTYLQKGVMEYITTTTHSTDANYTPGASLVMPDNIFLLTQTTLTANRTFTCPTPTACAALVTTTYVKTHMTGFTFKISIITSNTSFNWLLAFGAGWTTISGSSTNSTGASVDVYFTFTNAAGTTGNVIIRASSSSSLASRNIPDITVYGVPFATYVSAPTYYARDQNGSVKSSTNLVTLLNDIVTNWAVAWPGTYWRFPGPMYEFESSWAFSATNGPLLTNATLDFTGAKCVFGQTFGNVTVGKMITIINAHDFEIFGGTWGAIFSQNDSAVKSTYASLTSNAVTDPYTGSAYTDQYCIHQTIVTQGNATYPSCYRFSIHDMRLDTCGGLSITGGNDVELYNMHSFFCQGTVNFTQVDDTGGATASRYHVKNLRICNITVERIIDAAIDFNTTSANQTVENVMISQCRFEGHPAFAGVNTAGSFVPAYGLGHGIQISGSSSANTGNYKNISVRDCFFENFRLTSAIIGYRSTTGSVVANCTFVNCGNDLKYSGIGSNLVYTYRNTPIGDAAAIVLWKTQTNFVISDCAFYNCARLLTNYTTASTGTVHGVVQTGSSITCRNWTVDYMIAQMTNSSYPDYAIDIDRSTSSSNSVVGLTWRKSTDATSYKKIEAGTTQFCIPYAHPTPQDTTMYVDCDNRKVGINSLSHTAPSNTFEVLTVVQAVTGVVVDQQSEYNTSAFTQFNETAANVTFYQKFIPQFTGDFYSVDLYINNSGGAATVRYLIELWTYGTGSFPASGSIYSASGSSVGTHYFEIVCDGSTPSVRTLTFTAPSTGSFVGAFTAGNKYALVISHPGGGADTSGNTNLYMRCAAGYDQYPTERGGRGRRSDYTNGGTVPGGWSDMTGGAADNNGSPVFVIRTLPSNAGRRRIFSTNATGVIPASSGQSTSYTSAVRNEAFETYAVPSLVTTNATPATWGLDFSTITSQSFLFDAYVSAYRTDAANTIAHYKFTDGIIANKAGTCTLVAPSKVVVYEDAAGVTWDAGISLVASDLLISVTGEAAKTIRWSSSIIIRNPAAAIVN